MKKLLFILLAVALGGPAWAGPIEDADAAYQRGDYLTELRIIRPLAAKGEAWAQVSLAFKYLEGQGVAQNYSEAAKWLTLAAQQGYAPAQFNLGAMYANGNGVPEDIIRAHMWLNLAAVKGEALTVKYRDIVAKRMTSQQITDAQKLARDCLARNFKGCD